MGKKKGGKSSGEKAAPIAPCRVRMAPTSLPQHVLSDLPPNYSHFQPYFPLLDTFVKEDNKDIRDTDLTTGLVGVLPFPENTDQLFVKAIHLLSPDDWVQGNYEFTKDVALPGHSFGWENVVDKLQCPENQAYVDTLTVSLLSQLREQGLSPHFVKYYGASVAKATTYRYNMSDEYHSYKNRKWFWKNLNTSVFTLRVFSNEKRRFLNDDEVQQFMLTSEQIELLKEDDDASSSSSSSSIISLANDNNDTQGGNNNDDGLSIQSISLDDKDDKDVRSSTNKDDLFGILRVSPSNHTLHSNSEYDEDDDDEYEFYAEFKNMPVILVCMEKMEGVLDDLIDEKDVKDAISKETIWTAWLTQITFALIQAQAYIELTHNDLHGNNILYSKTDKEFLYYRSKNGQIWRVPTYGKIFHIIDFGRAILRVEGEQIISDDFFEGNDAAGQYNFGSIREPSLPAVHPNYSFDLVRLTVSLYDALKLSKGSPLQTLLSSWLLDTSGKSVLRVEEDGRERFPNFELYKHIASSCKGAVPKEQIRKPIFDAFKFSGDTQKEPIYPLFV